MRASLGGLDCVVENSGQSRCVVLFHGFGADFTDLVPLADFIDPEGEWTWIFPNGPSEVDLGGHMTGRAWFPISMAELEQSLATGVPRDYGSVEERPPAQLLKDLKMFVDEIATTYDEVVLGGFSQGGMIASHMAAVAGPKLKGLMLLSTVLLNQKALETSLEGVPPRPFFQSHGSRDPLLHIKFGQNLYQFLKKRGWQGSWSEFVGGHEIPIPVLLKARDFLHKLVSN